MPGVAAMGRPKKGAGKVGRPATAGERVAVIHLKGSPEYAGWLEQVHQATHIPKATIFRLAVADWARRNGHPVPPEL